MVEEREQAEKLRAELSEARAELVDKEGRVEDLTKKLKGRLGFFFVSVAIVWGRNVKKGRKRF